MSAIGSLVGRSLWACGARVDRVGDRRAISVVLSACVAGVWVYHGLVNKLLGADPRHLQIVKSVPGLDGMIGESVLALVGGAELLLAAWVLSRRAPLPCAAVQTTLLLAMNAAELVWARDLLISPTALLPVSLLFLAASWTAAVAVKRATVSSESTAAPLGLYLLRRHPVPVAATFRHSLVLTYALARDVLAPLLPPGLTLETYGEFGFVAVAMVQTRGLRPTFLPSACGQDFFLTGYRIFAKFRTPQGQTLRGLRILRSDADRWPMVIGGNLLTHYHYRKCRASVRKSAGTLDVDIRTPGADADVGVIANLRGPECLPAGSPFRSVHDARRFAGPLPYTFDYEAETHSIVVIKGVRQNWSPRLVPVDVRRMTFLDRAPLDGVRGAILASAFYVRDIPYRWERGVCHALDQSSKPLSPEGSP